LVPRKTAVVSREPSKRREVLLSSFAAPILEPSWVLAGLVILSVNNIAVAFCRSFKS
jgi:hypothetical protein